MCEKRKVVKDSVYWNLQSVNVKDKLKKKQGYDYLSWSLAWHEVKKLYPDATFYVYENQDFDKLPIFGNEKFGYSVKVSTTIEGQTYTSRLAVTNGANKPLKDSGYSYQVYDKQKQDYVKKQVEAIGIDDIENTVQRALVKSLGYHGLGLSVWIGDGLPEVILEIITAKKEKEIVEDISLLESVTELNDYFNDLRVDYQITKDTLKIYEQRKNEIEELGDSQ